MHENYAGKRAARKVNRLDWEEKLTQFHASCV